MSMSMPNQSKSKSNRNVIARAKPKAESNRIIATLAWKCHALSPPFPIPHSPSPQHTHTHTPLLGRSLLIFIVGSYLWLQYLPLTGNRWNFYESALAPFYFIYFCAYFCMGWQKYFTPNIFLFRVCNTNAHHTHTHSHIRLKHLHSAWFSIFIFIFFFSHRI